MNQKSDDRLTIWLVILTWNGLADTLDVLSSLREERAELLVVDNGSTDGTLTAVRDAYPEVHLIQTGANLGYAGGNNAGISFALSAGADVIGVLNNDTLVEPGFLSPLVATLTDTSTEGGAGRAVSPDIRYADDPDRSWWRGSVLDRQTGWTRHLLADEQPPSNGDPAATPVLSGCCIVTTAATWRRVGSFDEQFFLVFEDSDWSMRAASKGIELLVVPESRIRHKVSRSFTGITNSLGNYYFARNGVMFAWRYFGLKSTCAFLIEHVLRPSLHEAIRHKPLGNSLIRLIGVFAAVLGKRGVAGRIATRAAKLVANH